MGLFPVRPAGWSRSGGLGTIAVFVLSAIAYGVSAGPFIARQSPAPHFVYLADAFVHGRVFLDAEPPYSQQNDWTYYKGRWTVSFPPLPALLMLPFVAVAGKAFNDVIFTLLLGACNVALVHDIAPRIGRRANDGFEMDRKARLAMSLLFGFGTVHWWVASVGKVWFTAQIVALTFLLLALREALAGRRPLVVGVWLSVAALGRPAMLLSLPAFAWLLAPSNSPRRLLTGLAPFVLAGAFVAWYNYARFGDPFELGYRYMQTLKLFEPRLIRYGQFSLAYLGQNLYYAFLALPRWSSKPPFAIMDPSGLSMFVSTPALAYVFAAPWRDRLARASALAALAVAMPSLLYYNTGYVQAGYRFALDFIPFLLVLIVLGMRGRLTGLGASLILISIAMGAVSLVNFYGM